MVTFPSETWSNNDLPGQRRPSSNFGGPRCWQSLGQVHWLKSSIALHPVEKRRLRLLEVRKSKEHSESHYLHGRVNYTFAYGALEGRRGNGVRAPSGHCRTVVSCGRRFSATARLKRADRHLGSAGILEQEDSVSGHSVIKQGYVRRQLPRRKASKFSCKSAQVPIIFSTEIGNEAFSRTDYATRAGSRGVRQKGGSGRACACSPSSATTR